MIDLDSPDLPAAKLEEGLAFINSVKGACKPGIEYDYVEKYTKIVGLNGDCTHFEPRVQLTALRFADGSGLFTQVSIANLQAAQRAKCEECYILEFAYYSEIHELPPFYTGTIAQIRFATKVRVQAHKVHEESIRRFIEILTESSWWLDNSSRLRHKKIWRELAELSVAELQQINQVHTVKREKQEDERVRKALR